MSSGLSPAMREMMKSVFVRVQEVLGLDLSKIKLGFRTPEELRARGQAQEMSDGRVEILLSTALTPDQMFETLNHECRHAYQILRRTGLNREEAELDADRYVRDAKIEDLLRAIGKAEGFGEETEFADLHTLCVAAEVAADAEYLRALGFFA